MVTFEKQYGDTFIATPSFAKIPIPDDGVETLFGSYDEHLKYLEQLFSVEVRTDGHELLVTGDPDNVSKVERVMTQLTGLIRSGHEFSNGDVRRAAELVAQDASVDLGDFFRQSPVRPSAKVNQNALEYEGRHRAGCPRP